MIVTSFADAKTFITNCPTSSAQSRFVRRSRTDTRHLIKKAKVQSVTTNTLRTLHFIGIQFNQVNPNIMWWIPCCNTTSCVHLSQVDIYFALWSLNPILYFLRCSTVFLAFAELFPDKSNRLFPKQPFIGQKPEWPLPKTFRWWTATCCHEFCFLQPIEFFWHMRQAAFSSIKDNIKTFEDKLLANIDDGFNTQRLFGNKTS